MDNRKHGDLGFNSSVNRFKRTIFFVKECIRKVFTIISLVAGFSLAVSQRDKVGV